MTSSRPVIHGRDHADGGADPIPGLSTTDAVRFNNANDSLLLRFLHFVLTQADADGYGIHINDDTGTHGSLYEAEQSVLIRTQDGSSSLLIRDSSDGITVHSTDRLLLDTAGLDGGGNVAENFADGVSGTDLATVEQITGAVADAILYDIANSGGSLTVTTTGLNGDSLGLEINETNAGGQGILISSDNASINVIANNGSVVLAAGGAEFIVTDTAVTVALPAGIPLTVYNHLAAPILQMTEGSPDLHIQAGGTLVADL